MRDEPDPAHPRPPEIALAAGGRHGDMPDARAQDGGRQVVPDFRHEDEAADARDRNEAEIAEIDLLPGQERKQQPVQGIPDLERWPLRSFDALGDNDVPRPLAARCEQPWQVRRAVFAVAVHDKDAVQIVAPRDVDETDSDRPLMAEIEPELQDLDPADGTGR